jgi:PPM family protein phosphatase
MTFDAWSMTDIGLVRKSNQDSVGCFPELNLFVVADGMGGHADGEVASSMAVALIRESLLNHRAAALAAQPGGVMNWIRRHLRRGADLMREIEIFSEEQIEHAIAMANQRIFETGQANSAKGQDRPLGTTVVVLELDRVRAYWGHVGDSRLYRVRGGRLELLTADHTTYGQPYATHEEIPVDIPHTNKLLQAVGVSLDVQIPTRSAPVFPGDLYLLCSDGVSGFVEAPVILQELTADQSLENVGRGLIDRALETGGRDNVSVVVVKVDDGDEPPLPTVARDRLT